MSRALSQEQVARYAREGVLAPIRVLSAAEAGRYRAAIEELETQLGEVQDYAAWCHLFFRWAYDLATHPAVLDVVESILGPNVIIRSTLLLSKNPRDARSVSWHQDGYHSDFDQTHTTSAWIALSDSTTENGCMRVIPASHNQGALAHAWTETPNALLRKGADVQVPVEESQARHLTLRAGELSLHHVHLIHGSAANSTDSRRIGFILRCVTPEFSKSDIPVIHARGAADCSHLKVLQHPPDVVSKASIEAWRAFLREQP